jgi:hypothetical protein
MHTMSIRLEIFFYNKDGSWKDSSGSVAMNPCEDVQERPLHGMPSSRDTFPERMSFFLYTDGNGDDLEYDILSIEYK